MKRFPKLKIFDEKKEETVKDYGSYTIPERWEDVTLSMFEDYMRKTDGGEKTIDETEILQIFTGKKKEEIENLPINLYNALLSRLSFMEKPINQNHITNEIEIEGIELIVNTQEQMKQKEFADLNSLIKNDQYDYSGMLAVMCRKKTETIHDELTDTTIKRNEPYDADFANTMLEARKELFKKQPMTKVMPIVGFFLNLWLTSPNNSRQFLETIRTETDLCAANLGNSIDTMDLPYWKKAWLKAKLRKLRKTVKSI